MRPLVLLALCSSLAGSGCAVAPVVPRSTPDEARLQLREQARQEVSAPCGRCHAPPGKRPALAVFDLTEDDWAARMSPQQFPTFLRRLGGDDPLHPSPSRRYLEAEAARREPTPRQPER